MQGRLAGLVVGLVTFVLMAAGGCTSEAGGNPTPQPTTGVSESGSEEPSSESSAPSEDETYGAPAVDTPLDATAFLTQPCAVLSQTQLAAFDVSRPGIPTTTGAVAENAGPFCTWHANPDLGSTIGVGFLTGNKNGLSDTYRGRGQFEYFEPTTVEEYPAVYASSPDLRASGDCLIVVGISDSLTFNATEQGRLDAQGSCDRALAVATAALATLTGGG
ncbi:DUF3558 family protein [Actinophytocola sp.]|uniref:DUF3558 family protein n=1 Tax=Actinophytocola sp. TaxID=1872138 RepID=UPI0025C4510B|nr:DUF3558 family protein [Actinophytocola sp.]